MKKIYLLALAIVFCCGTTVTAQSVNSHKNTIKKGQQAAKTGKVSSPPGSSNFTKLIEKKAAKSRAEAQKKKDSGSKSTTKKENQTNPKK